MKKGAIKTLKQMQYGYDITKICCHDDFMTCTYASSSDVTLSALQRLTNPLCSQHKNGDAMRHDLINTALHGTTMLFKLHTTYVK
jgi:hypothetical protein